MTALLVLLGLLSVATLASRRGAVDELLSSAATPLLVGLGVLLSPGLLGVLLPSVLDGLAPAIDVGACALAFFVGVRAASTSPFDAGPRPVVIGALGVIASCAVAFGVLWFAAPHTGALGAGASPVAAALLVGACLAGLPADPAGTEPRLRNWAHVTEACVACAAGAALVLLSSDRATALAIVAAIAACGAVVLWLLPASDSVARTTAVLGVLTLIAGLSRLTELPPALSAFIAGALVARSPARRALIDIAASAERPVRVVVTVVIASAVGIGWTDALLGVALAVGQLVVQGGSAWGLGVHRTQLGAAIASSPTPIAMIASFFGAAHVAAAVPLLPAILVAVAVSDFFAVAVSVAQRREPEAR